MKMYQRLREYLDKSKLLSKATIQNLIWQDKGKEKIHVVFRPNGGSALSGTLGNEYHVLIDFIAPANKPSLIDDLVANIADYIMTHPLDDDLGLVQIMGAIPTPIVTADDRLIYRLQVAIKHGK